jgi:hypothetical protein
MSHLEKPRLNQEAERERRRKRTSFFFGISSPASSYFAGSAMQEYLASMMFMK